MTAGADSSWRAEAEAHKRAMPMQRLIGNGMDYADVVDLYAAVDTGRPWPDAAAALGELNAERAGKAAAQGHFTTARDWHLRASACYRVGQVPLADSDPRKRDMYRSLIGHYGRAGELSDPPVDHVEIPYDGGALCGWLLRPSDVPAPPVVIVMGGFDGWREEYHVGAEYLLARNVAAFLVDGPGQGETRLFHGLHMDSAVAKAFSAVIDYLLTDRRLRPTVGIWGNSMGGYLAALTAATDDRIAACCVNGGTIRPAEILDRYHRFAGKVMPLLGIDDPDRARHALEQFTLSPELLGQLTCPLLVLHGTPDRVFLVANARALHDAAGSADKRFHEWVDGDHCLYNHSHEKHVLVADWFADRLYDTTATNGSSPGENL
ncbi:Alpha/beta hydrolase family protein [Nocardia amikacinitolerans]|nr:Alpha/beta hydrolase family protein [Nocardia amikacinitolerans]MCP2297994.1 Alpha/beta hydrolase family protein [Nocardia amikacinitolerans]